LIKKRNRNEINGMAIQQENDGGLRELALFAGAGGGILGGKLLGWRTVCAVEWDAYAASVLVARQNDGCLPAFPIWDDVQTFDGRAWRGRIEVISGGFPCQDISAAGKGAGIEGERSGMWKHMARIIGEVRPRFAFVENSPMLVGRGLGTVLADLASMGYDAQWGIVGANHTGAPHKRDRIWIMANAKDLQRNGSKDHAGISVGRESVSESRNGGGAQDVADAESQGLERRIMCGSRGMDGGFGQSSEAEQGWWTTEPDVGRVAHGVAARVDRLRAIGNGQVPAVAKLAWEILAENSDFS